MKKIVGSILTGFAFVATLSANTCVECEETFYPQEGENGVRCRKCIARRDFNDTAERVVNFFDRVQEESERRDARIRRRKEEDEARRERFRQEREQRQREMDRLFVYSVRDCAEVEIYCENNADDKRFAACLFEAPCVLEGNIFKRPLLGSVAFKYNRGYAPNNLKTEQTVVGANELGDDSRDIYGKDGPLPLNFFFKIGSNGFSTTYYIPKSEYSKKNIGLFILDSRSNNHCYLFVDAKLKHGKYDILVSSTSRGIKVRSVFFGDDGMENKEWELPKSEKKYSLLDLKMR